MKEYLIFETIDDYEDALEFLMEDGVRDVVPNPDRLEIAISMFDLRMAEDILDSAVIPFTIYR